MVNIRDRRLSLGMTQKELGDHVGVGQITISRWEFGRAYPHADQAIRLAAALECDVTDLPLGPMVNIRDRRVYLGMTQKELGERVGVSSMTISRWEFGRAYPRADRAIRLAAALECDVTDLVPSSQHAQNSA